MTDAARSAADSPAESDLRSAPSNKKRLADAPPKARSSRGPRAKKPAAGSALRAAAPPGRRGEASGTLAQPATSVPSQATAQLGTLLVGAGLGAALTLSVVALGSRRGRGSSLALAATKTISFAIERTTERGSLLNLVARAVGSAIA